MPYSEAQHRATEKYKAKAYTKVTVEFRNEEYNAMKKHLNQTGESMNGFIRRAVMDSVEK